jgi:hypothetical protein
MMMVTEAGTCHVLGSNFSSFGVNVRAFRMESVFVELRITVKELDLFNLFIRKLQYLIIEVLCCTELLGCKSLNSLVFWHKPAL